MLCWLAFISFICSFGFIHTSTLSVPTESKDELEILHYNVQTNVISRYAMTTISYTISNKALAPAEALFSVLLPKNSFISNLTIDIGGCNYTSLVKEKEEARKTYEKAKATGGNAVLVHKKERETSRFGIDVNVAAEDQVIVYLAYEELLERNLGTYTLIINVHPNYPVKNMLVDVTFQESKNIKNVNVLKVPGGADYKSAAKTIRQTSTMAQVQFNPDPISLIENDIFGQLVIEYDVARSLDAGEVQIDNEYFVHFFAPNKLRYTPKHITFVIDTSGSMSGFKIQQVKEAFRSIIFEINKRDWFTVIQFSSSANRLISADYNPLSARKAGDLVKALQADGSTDIDSGLRLALMEPQIKSEGPVSRIVILLTDGQASAGVTDYPTILKNAKTRNELNAAIFCLGFGESAEMNLLERLALQNGGRAYKIYEEGDAAEQLTNFYQSLSSPLLLDVQFAYADDVVILDSLTKNTFYNYFYGKELVVTGQLSKPNVNNINAIVTGKGTKGDFAMTVNDFDTFLPPEHALLERTTNFISRLWAFLKIKNLLDREKAAMDKTIKTIAKQKVVELALKYHFVTPFTSLVVVQPNSETCKNYDDNESDETGEIDNSLDSILPQGFDLNQKFRAADGRIRYPHSISGNAYSQGDVSAIPTTFWLIINLLIHCLIIQKLKISQ